MSKTFDYVIIFGVGVVTGVVGSREYFKSKYKTLADKEIESTKHAYSVEKARIEANNTIKENKKPVDILNESQLSSVPPKLRSDILAEYDGESERTAVNYQEFYSKDDIPEGKPLEVEMAEKEFPSESGKAYLISEEEYMDSQLLYDKMSCTFYVPDRVLVDDISREVVEQDILGDELIEYLVRTDDLLVYIRNDNLSCDLEISKQESSISETGDSVWFG